ncbi:MAG: RHS repeat protein [Dehalococcoidia bacterium]|nr:RHS repeat protein [Dehalococcoidia bacterium]
MGPRWLEPGDPRLRQPEVGQSVTDWNSNSTTYSYDDAGRMTSTTLPSGTGIISSYVDGLGSTKAIVDSSGVSQKSRTSTTCAAERQRGAGFQWIDLSQIPILGLLWAEVPCRRQGGC